MTARHTFPAARRDDHEAVMDINVEGGNGGTWGEIRVAYDIEPGSRGSWDVPPSDDGVSSWSVTGWRHQGKGAWIEPEGPLLAILSACVDDDWLMEQARDAYDPDIEAAIEDRVEARRAAE